MVSYSVEASLGLPVHIFLLTFGGHTVYFWLLALPSDSHKSILEGNSSLVSNIESVAILFVLAAVKSVYSDIVSVFCFWKPFSLLDLLTSATCDCDCKFLLL